MSLIPPNQVTLKDMVDWFNLQVQLRKIKTAESLLRRKIFNAYFPAPREGANNHTLPDGWVLSGTHSIDRVIDEPMLKLMWDELIQARINPSEMVRQKPELNVKAYRELTEEQRRLFNRCLIVKDGSPTLEIKPPAITKGKG